MLLARALGLKVIAHIHGSKLDVQFRNSDRIQKYLMKIALRIPHRILVLSEFWRKIITEEISPTLNIVVIPNSVDLSIADAMEKKLLNNKKNKCSVLFLGWLGARKGFFDALHAAELVYQQIPEIRFVFAGPVELGPHIEAVNQACKTASLGGYIDFPGLVEGEEKIALLSKASIFILPSYHENLPVAILEAMSMGLPVIATHVAGVPELIEHGRNGFLIQPGDYRSLGEQIIRLANDPEICQSMGKTNIAKIKREYHPKIFAFKISKLYHELLENRSAE